MGFEASSTAEMYSLALQFYLLCLLFCEANLELAVAKQLFPEVHLKPRFLFVVAGLFVFGDGFSHISGWAPSLPLLQILYKWGY